MYVSIDTFLRGYFRHLKQWLQQYYCAARCRYTALCRLFWWSAPVGTSEQRNQNTLTGNAGTQKHHETNRQENVYSCSFFRFCCCCCCILINSAFRLNTQFRFLAANERKWRKKFRFMIFELFLLLFQLWVSKKSKIKHAVWERCWTDSASKVHQQLII